MSGPSSTPVETALAAAEGLFKAYPGGVRALDGADLRVGPGEIVGLIGANGSGKSTLLGILSGRIRPDAGQALVAGYDPGSREARSRTGYSAQEQALDAEMTGRETAAYFATLQGIPRGGARIEALLKDFGLSERAGDRVGSYSGGMRQRLHLLLAFLHDPQLALLDEPTNGLDPDGRDAFWRILHRRSEGRGALLSLHDLAEAQVRCARIVMLATGRVQAEGAPADLVRRHGAWHWRADFSDHPGDPGKLRGSLAALPGVLALDVEDDGVSLWLADGGTADADILERLRAGACEPKAYHRRRPDLASVYRLTAGRAWGGDPGERRPGGGGAGRGGGRRAGMGRGRKGGRGGGGEPV